MKIPMTRPRPRYTAPADPGYGKSFSFGPDGGMKFSNFSAAEIVTIVNAFHDAAGSDAVTTYFRDGRFTEEKDGS